MAGSEVDSDVAIIGMSCRVAGANSPSDLWTLLASSKDVQSEITRFNCSKGFYHPDGASRKGLTNVKMAYMMDDKAIEQFDHAFFHTSPREAAAMDPQQRLLLEIAYEAVENAGIPLNDFSGSDTAVYAGMEGSEYNTILARDIDATPAYSATGTSTCMPANRISYAFNLSGPSLVVDTACSSAMVALHQAVRSLRSNEAGMALVCGAKLILSPDMFVPSSEMGFLSSSGRCRSFDAAGDGYGRGEGVLALLLKPLEAALADRDPVRAVVKGSRVNQDGKTKGITLPSADAQQRNMQSLYERLMICPNDIQYLEAHGTGTAAGDPLEFSAINAVFNSTGTNRSNSLIVGSIKSNVGHLESSSALAAIVKTVLCLEKGKIPVQMHFVNPNTNIDFRRVTIPVGLMDWPGSEQAVRRAAINSFGAGGTNSHLVLEEHARLSPSVSGPDRSYLFKVSAADDDSVERLLLRFADYVETSKPSLPDLANTLLSRRSTLRRSVFFVARTHEEAVAKLRPGPSKIRTTLEEVSQEVAFVYTGQGAQWAQMGSSLLNQSPLFKAILIECERILATLPDKPSWSIIEELSKTNDESRVHKSEFSQPLCTALQLGLTAMWRSWGLIPKVVMGHSSGEIGAAYAAGLISLRDAIIIAYYRGLVLARSPVGSSPHECPGSMCAVGLGEEDACSLLAKYSDRVQLAAVNSPTNCTLSGDADAVKDIIDCCIRSGTFCRNLRVDRGEINHTFDSMEDIVLIACVAYHSNHMLPTASQYEESLFSRNTTPRSRATSCEMFSSVHGRRLAAEDLSPSYWREDMVSTVRFSSALEACLYSCPEISAVVEVGPHPALKGPILENLQKLGRDSIAYYSSCSRGIENLEALLKSAGAMIGHGVRLKAANINALEIVDGLMCHYKYSNVLTDLPSYQWKHSVSFWEESRVSRNVRHRQFRRHELLGSRYVDDIPSRPSWRNHLILQEIPWLMEMKLSGIRDMPAAAYILMAFEAARQLQQLDGLDTSVIGFSGFVFEKDFPLVLFRDAHTTIEIQLIARQTEEDRSFGFEILSAMAGYQTDWTRHCRGKFHINNTSVDHLIATTYAPEHDPILLEQSQVFGYDTSSHLKGLRLDPQGSTGHFYEIFSSHEHYPLPPMVLDSILGLSPASLLARNLPAAYKLRSIGCMKFPIHVENPVSGKFATAIGLTHSYGCHSSIEITQDHFVSNLDNLYYEVDGLLTPEPIMKSLFFKSRNLPDITRQMKLDVMTLQDCVKLITHKWPMTDVKVAGLDDGDIRILLETLENVSADRRRSFRSVQILEAQRDAESEFVQYVDSFDLEIKAHIIFSSHHLDLAQLANQLEPNGFACTRGSTEMELSSSFEMVCGVTGLRHDDWVLWRMTQGPDLRLEGCRTVLFGCLSQKSLSLENLKASEHIPLQPHAIRNFCERSTQGRFNAVVLEDSEKSVITTWQGRDLVPWLQILVKLADSVLWITIGGKCSPFANVAGTLLRTLQSEQPSLKVTWLVLRNEEPAHILRQHISSAYSNLLNGENEVTLEANESQTSILRYVPDNDLSVRTGISLPALVTEPIGNRNYELLLAAPSEAVILSSTVSISHGLESTGVEVQVEASVVDICTGINSIQLDSGYTVSPSLGKFFAGRIISGTEPQLPIGSQVVGWHYSPHQKRLEVPARQLYLSDGKLSFQLAAAVFAALAVASCIVDGVARAREGDTFLVQFDGLLEEALQKLCRQVGAICLKPDGNETADFVVSLDPSGNILTNGSTLPVEKYLDSVHGSGAVARAWNSPPDFASDIQIFQFSAYKEAIHAAILKPNSVVLIHQKVDEINSHVVMYRNTQRLLAKDGIYIIVGGLGGLGRYVCSWMVAHGARNLVAISRSGLVSEEAQETFRTINESMGCSMQVIQADACDRTAIVHALAQIRQTGLIKGIVNLAMVLGDAAMADMTGDQWDRVLRVKIESAWIFHEETLKDPVEVFILFSSIASVLGNRNQGNYNVGNTFLNALAEYRQTLGLPAISIALGAMADVGILYSLGNKDLLRTLTRSGLSHLQKPHLAKIMEAAVLESPRRDRSLILTGLEMFERVDGKIADRPEQLYWTELPEFGHLQVHKRSDLAGQGRTEISLRNKIKKLEDDGAARTELRDAFIIFLSQMLRLDRTTFTERSDLTTLGFDSLSAVSCQYWFFRELGVDVKVSELESLIIENMLKGVMTKFRAKT
ncbi:hypothetical protein MMC07_004155 [Pseudocyphellaria aurata]|nr:hypothetical protein [Pseudocyphellaria aurata]